MEKNFPGTKIPWYRMNACMKLAFYYYFNDANSNAEFENILDSASGYSLSERRAVKQYFKNEIYPVDKTLARWMWSLGGEEYYFKTLLSELKKTHKITKKKKTDGK